MTEITIRPMSTRGLDPVIAATLIGKSDPDVDLQEIETIMDLRLLERFLCTRGSIYIATDTNGGPVGVAILQHTDAFEQCKRLVETRLVLFVPDREVTVYSALVDAAVMQSHNEGARHIFIENPSQEIRDAVKHRKGVKYLKEETLVLT